MSGTIRQEDAIRATKEEKRGKRAAPGPSGGAPAKYRLVYTLSAGQPRSPPPQQQWGYRTPEQVALRPPAHPQQPAPPRALQTAGLGYPCFNYGRPGHFAQDCRQPQQGY
jgi:hypothetical protein